MDEESLARLRHEVETLEMRIEQSREKRKREEGLDVRTFTIAHLTRMLSPESVLCAAKTMLIAQYFSISIDLSC